MNQICLAKIRAKETDRVKILSECKYFNGCFTHPEIPNIIFDNLDGLILSLNRKINVLITPSLVFHFLCIFHQKWD